METIKLTISYLPILSKNKRYVGRFKKVKNPEHARAQEMITYELISILRGKPKPIKDKVWVSIFLYKPTMRLDAINLINPICDAIKNALGVDDNLYACDCDWALDKKNPRIDIVITYQKS